MFKKCKICNGKGFVENKDWGKLFCNICQGKGGFDVPNDKELCPECYGRGHYTVETNCGRNIEQNCLKCSGTGFIEKFCK